MVISAMKKEGTDLQKLTEHLLPSPVSEHQVRLWGAQLLASHLPVPTPCMPDAGPQACMPDARACICHNLQLLQRCPSQRNEWASMPACLMPGPQAHTSRAQGKGDRRMAAGFMGWFITLRPGELRTTRFLRPSLFRLPCLAHTPTHDP